MKKIALSLLAAGLMVGQAQAATVDSLAINPHAASAFVDTTRSASVELVLGHNALTTFTLNDTTPDLKKVTYSIFHDSDLRTGFVNATGPAVATADLTDTNTIPPFFRALLSTGQYVLNISMDGATRFSETEISAVPLPGAALLFGSALFGAGALRRKKRAEEMATVAV